MKQNNPTSFTAHNHWFLRQKQPTPRMMHRSQKHICHCVSSCQDSVDPVQDYLKSHPSCYRYLLIHTMTVYMQYVKQENNLR